jgi:hypothetical protein
MIQGITHSDQLKDQIAELSSASLISATKDDVKILGSHVDNGFDRLVDAINSGRGQAHQNPITKTPIEKPSLVPPAVEPIRFTERRTASTNWAAPYGLQVIIQTNVTIQPAGLKILCDNEIASGDFFRRRSTRDDGGSFRVVGRQEKLPSELQVSAANPRISVLVTLRSSKDIHVTRVEQISAMF